MEQNRKEWNVARCGGRADNIRTCDKSMRIQEGAEDNNLEGISLGPSKSGFPKPTAAPI